MPEPSEAAESSPANDDTIDGEELFDEILRINSGFIRQLASARVVIRHQARAIADLQQQLVEKSSTHAESG